MIRWLSNNYEPHICFLEQITGIDTEKEELCASA